MNLESQIYTIPFSKREDLSYEFSLNRDFARDGNYLLGVSGSATSFCYIKSGRIYDSQNNFIYSSNYDSNLLIKTDILNGVSVTYINDIILSKNNVSGYFDNLIISGNKNTYIGAKLNVETPKLSFLKLNDFYNSGNIMSGVLTNSRPDLLYKITGASISSNSDLVSVSGYTSGNISGNGYVWLNAETGVPYPSGNNGLILNTDFGNVSFSIDSSPTNLIDPLDYLRLNPSYGYISTSQNKSYELVSYYNFGSERNIQVSLELVSGAYYLPILMYYNYSGSGDLSNLITGSGDLTGIISGVFTGTNETGTSGYSIPYVFTGNYAGTGNSNISGRSSSGASSGLMFSGTGQTGYSVTLNSGNLGIISGQFTDVLTGVYDYFSGYKSQSFNFGSKIGTNPDYFLTGYTGMLTNYDSGLRSSIVSGKLYYSLTISGLGTGEDSYNSVFLIDKWVNEPIVGGPQNTGYIAPYSYQTISSGNNFSGQLSPGVIVYTGSLLSNYYGYLDFEDLIPSQTSGNYYVNISTPIDVDYDFLGIIISGWYTTGNWSVSNFSILNFPVRTTEIYNVTGTGFFEKSITGLVSKFTSGILNTGVLESSGVPDFLDVWNLKTGINEFSFRDFKYWGNYSGNKYENTGSFIRSSKSKENSFYIGVNHNGLGLSGFNVSKLRVSDGVLSGEYLLSGQGEYYS